jgi:hypothetical protein
MFGAEAALQREKKTELLRLEAHFFRSSRIEHEKDM